MLSAGNSTPFDMLKLINRKQLVSTMFTFLMLSLFNHLN